MDVDDRPPFHAIWSSWVHFLHRWGMHDLVASLLESAGPLTIVFVQMVYLGKPLLTHMVPQSHLEALVNMLEKPQETMAFALYLREDIPL